jgi:hypothetical protein
MNPMAIRCTAPSRVAAGEPFSLKIKLLGPVNKIPCSGNFCDRKPALQGPFNLNVARQIQYHDNCLPEWSGQLITDAGPALTGPDKLVFDGKQQDVFPGDTRPIQKFGGFTLNAPGFYFIRVVDSKSGIEGVSNPIYVTEKQPDYRIFWGDPHWQTFFSDGKTKQGCSLDLAAASEEGLHEAAIVLNGIDVQKLQPGKDTRIIINDDLTVRMGPGDFCYGAGHDK